MLDKIYYGNSLRDWGISLLIIVIALLIKKIVVLNKHVIAKITAKSKSSLDNILFDALIKPILLGVILIAIWVATMRLTLGENAHNIISGAYKMLTVINVTWLFARLASAIISDYSKPNKNRKRAVSNKLLPLLKRLLLGIIWAIGIVTALNNVGVNVGTLLGTLGLGGVAVALAAQDTIKNIFGGITILSDNPFRIGDIISFDGIEGTVRDIGMRSTRIYTIDNRMITVPNYKLMDAFVTNISVEPSRRVTLNLGLTYHTAPNKMEEAIAILKTLPESIKEIDQKTTAVFSDFSNYALTITYIYNIKKSADIRETTSKVNFEILNKFSNANLDFAFPSQTIYLNKVD